MDELDGVPQKVLGHQVKTRTQIVLACLTIPILEFIVYLVVTIADITVAIQHFLDGNRIYGALTITLIVLPSLICFVSVIVSPWQWPEEQGCYTENWIFFLKQLFNLICFPLGALYRLSRRIFWSIESLFHDRDSYERHHAVSKAAETSSFELYHFLQAFVQAAPQIILQLYIILREDVFRNFETTEAQIISIIFSLITMAVIIESYQRFESQKVVGRNYPWATEHQQQTRNRLFRRTKSHVTAESTRAASANNQSSYIELPESEHIMKRFNSTISSNTNNSSVGQDVYQNNIIRQNSHTDDDDNNSGLKRNTNVSYLRNKSLHLGDNIDEADDEDDINQIKTFQLNVNIEQDNSGDKKKFYSSDTVDNDNNQNLQNLNRKRKESIDFNRIDKIESIGGRDGGGGDGYASDTSDGTTFEKPIDDKSPEFEPPPPPPFDVKHILINRMSTLKDMLWLNAELYLKDHVPRLPERLFHHDDEEKVINKNYSMNEQPPSPSPVSPGIRGVPSNTADEVDFILPTRRIMVEGIEQEDFIGKTVAFTGWLMFLFMRLLALSAFSVFFPMECLYLCLAHYLLMLLCLYYETKFHEKIERTFFYLFLGYIYIICILEFKIKFKRPRIWYVLYVTLMLAQNLTITLVWYLKCEFESWWFEFMFITIMLSCGYSLLCLVFYFCLLKPADKILFENE